MTVGRAIARQDDGRIMAHKKAAIPRFREWRQRGFRLWPRVFFPLILNLLKDEGKEYPRPDAYFRVRRMTFLQVAIQVRLCRAASCSALPWWLTKNQPKLSPRHRSLELVLEPGLPL